MKPVCYICLIVGLSVVIASRPVGMVVTGSQQGSTVLPSEWRLTPAGRHVSLGDLPLKMMLTPDRKYILAATNGYNEQGLKLLDVETGSVVARVPVRQSYCGLDVTPAGTVFLSGARSGKVFQFRYARGKVELEDAITIPSVGAEKGFLTGLAAAPKSNTLLVLDSEQDTLIYLDLKSRQVTRTVRTHYRPYQILVDTAGEYAYISNWGARSVSRLDIAQGTLDATLAAEDHPTDMAFSRDGGVLFVANSNSDTVTALDLKERKAIETISLGLTPRSPQGAEPMGLALSPDGKTLAVANAGNNDVALVEVSTPGKSRVLGFIPTGWYPTSTLFDPAGKRLFIGSGKGLGSTPNPTGPVPGMQNRTHIRSLIPGSLSIVDVPDAGGLRKYTEQVTNNCPYRDGLLEKARETGVVDTIVPSRVGAASPIQYVLYIIKENRTYDQVFGDLREGNGDPSLVLFGENVTPNQHKLAREFVLLDNFYCSGDVSADGHPWSTSAFVTDFTEKMWPGQYSQRYRTMADPEQMLGRPRGGYIWELAEKMGLSVRSYGEMVLVRSLEGKTSPDYRPKSYDRPWRDSDRADIFLREFDEFERNGNLPRLMVMSLPENHTAGTRPGAFTPVAMVASGDRALGRIIERVTHSRYYKEMAVLVLEDDAQNGPDHVDSHRSPALVISPYSRLRRVDSDFYSTCSMLRTIELLLGLPPLTQYDAAALPMYRSFGRQADLTPYTAVGARVDLNAKNPADAYGARASMTMNFDEVDMAPEQELNEILWKSIRGANSPLPPPVRRLLPEAQYARR